MANDLEVSYFGEFVPLITWVNVLIFANVVLGIVMLEVAWYKTRRFRKPIEELDAKFHFISRSDAIKWKKWKQYPGAVTIMIPRLLLFVLVCFVMAVLLNICLIGHNRSTPVTGCRFFFVRGIFYIFVTIMSIVCFFTFQRRVYKTLEEVNFYEEYLGTREEQRAYQSETTEEHPDVPKRGIGRSSTLVSNHIGFVEIMAFTLSPLNPSYTAKQEVDNIPLVRSLAHATQSLFV